MRRHASEPVGRHQLRMLPVKRPLVEGDLDGAATQQHAGDDQDRERRGVASRHAQTGAAAHQEPGIRLKSAGAGPKLGAVDFEGCEDVKEFDFEEPARGFFEWREIFPQLGSIRDARKEILDEVGSLGSRSWFEWPQYELWKTPGQSWDVLPLIGFGRRMLDNLAGFPRLARLLAGVPGLRTAIFSRVGPGTSIEPHRGPFALSSNILRCHFGIRAPEPSGVWVRGEFRQLMTKMERWGDALTFEDRVFTGGLSLNF